MSVECYAAKAESTVTGYSPWEFVWSKLDRQRRGGGGGGGSTHQEKRRESEVGYKWEEEGVVVFSF